MFYQKEKKYKSEKGFTMVESLVAITILLIAVIGPLSLLATALRDSVYLKNEIVANYLTQEGLEVITYYNATEGGLDSGFYCINGTGSNKEESITKETSPDDNCTVGLDDDGYYGKNGQLGLIFIRYVEIEKVSNDMIQGEDGQEFRITSKTFWKNSGLLPDRDIAYTTYLYSK